MQDRRQGNGGFIDAAEAPRTNDCPGEDIEPVSVCCWGSYQQLRAREGVQKGGP